jgi:hypothetical protein
MDLPGFLQTCEVWKKQQTTNLTGLKWTYQVFFQPVRSGKKNDHWKISKKQQENLTGLKKTW